MLMFGPGFARRNWAVFVPEYPGYARDPSGAAPSQELLLDHAVKLVDHLTMTGHAAQGKPLVLVGHSLGGAVAVFAASQTPALVHSALLFGPISSVSDVAATRVPYVPFRWFVHDNFDACAWARLVICPVTVVRGTADVIVPPSVSQHLEGRFPVAPQVVVLQNATHNDLFVTHADQVWRAADAALDNAALFQAVCE
jgi:pimeloyl-ACP methyl ester carboxylesterase